MFRCVHNFFKLLDRSLIERSSRPLRALGVVEDADESDFSFVGIDTHCTRFK